MKGQCTSQFEDTVGQFDSIYHERPCTLFSTNTYWFNDRFRYDAGLGTRREEEMEGRGDGGTRTFRRTSDRPEGVE
jgi:hypothetical protein